MTFLGINVSRNLKITSTFDNKENIILYIMNETTPVEKGSIFPRNNGILPENSFNFGD